MIERHASTPEARRAVTPIPAATRKADAPDASARRPARASDAPDTPLGKRLFAHRHLYLMLVPGLLFLAIMHYLPMFGTIIAFKEVDYALGIFRSPWVGLKNFEFLFASRDSWIAIRNTLAYNAVFIVTGPLVSVSLAILLNELVNRRFRKVYQTIVILPHFVSFVVVSYLVYAFLSTNDGFINRVLILPSGGDPIRWYLEPGRWPVILFLVNGWKQWGFGTVIYLATMAGFDSELYEAATIDGAGRWRQVAHITIPLLLPVIMLLFILSLGRIINADFGLFYQVPQGAGALIPTTQVLDTYVYRALLVLSDIGLSSAAAFLQSVVGFMTIVTVNLVVRRLRPDWSVF
jgi:putative aldouronate transport system permease protein